MPAARRRAATGSIRALKDMGSSWGERRSIIPQGDASCRAVGEAPPLLRLRRLPPLRLPGSEHRRFLLRGQREARRVATRLRNGRPPGKRIAYRSCDGTEPEPRCLGASAVDRRVAEIVSALEHPRDHVTDLVLFQEIVVVD